MEVITNLCAAEDMLPLLTDSGFVTGGVTRTALLSDDLESNILCARVDWNVWQSCWINCPICSVFCI